MLKRNYSVLLLICSVVFIFPVFSGAADEIVARVGDAVISEEQLQEAVMNYIPEGGFHSSVDRSANIEYRKKALENLIEHELLLREARKRGIRIANDRIDNVMLLNVKKYGSDEEFKNALKRRGISSEDLRKRIMEKAMVSQLLESISSESICTDEILSKYYEDNHSKYKKPESLFIYHILISVDPAASEKIWQEKQAYAEQILEKIKAGEDFGSIAYQYSEDSYKYKSGALGFVHRGRLTPSELDDAAFSLNRDEVSGVIKTIHGFHIIKAGEKRLGEISTFDQVRESIKNQLEKNKFDSRKKEILELMRKEYPVEILIKTETEEEKK